MTAEELLKLPVSEAVDSLLKFEDDEEFLITLWDLTKEHSNTTLTNTLRAHKPIGERAFSVRVEMEGKGRWEELYRIRNKKEK